MKTINAWWSKGPPPGNFGDILTPFLVEHFGDRVCVFTNKNTPSKTPVLFGTGSILALAQNNTVIWGSGMMRESDRTKVKRDATYLSVRGPRTYEILKERNVKCPPIFGDPALLMPEMYNRTDLPKRWKFGVFAHYVDTEQVETWYRYDPTVKIINPLCSNPLQVICQLLQCERIISSSLHGVITAHAYGIPAVWVKHSDKLNGDGIKFHDHFESVGLNAECIDFQEKISVDDLEKLNYQAGITIDTSKISRALQAYINEQSVSDSN